MADDKDKAKAKAPESPFNDNHLNETLFIVLPILILIGVLLNRFFAYLESLKYSAVDSLWEKIWLSLLHVWGLWKPWAFGLSLVALGFIIYNVRKLKAINLEEKKIYGHALDDEFLGEVENKPRVNAKWEKVLAHAHSQNPADWRVAIIEADVMLEDLLKAVGYDGEGIGEMLKKVEPSDMLTLDKAWEAHKIRNRIAHAGQDFDLTERETLRVIGLFEEVFNEFQII